ncbi:hypothetical protein BEWA_050530 [Theileria equi strain WA]|uniref:Uncharacterized protein n=1 Tax=Theileria equi strain WA TaxID=1537102 RepID=L1LBD6_THEEQ|nr:hypothetical protein BEWA_050530 [Theileria equi strain WA]EKX72585.1 hypothetical protein BEWA_050530 [Theileria equi strain WA]|eukprot:XP_004832037.1 hypothetical protein BEWA_050530 [Theileria equi strain WA]
MVAQPQVTIKLGVKPNDKDKNGKTYTGDSTGSKSVIIKVTRSFYPLDQGSTANFLKYTHEDKDNTGRISPFKLKAVKDGTPIPINGIPPNGASIPNVTSVSAYYWKYKPKTVLILGVTATGTKSETTYYVKNLLFSGGTKWAQAGTGNLDDEELENVLDQQNCYFNNAVTMNVYFTKSQIYTSGNNKYCCYYHEGTSGKGRVSVERKTVSCTSHISTRLTVYKHEFTFGDSSRLSGIKYYDGRGQRRRIKITGLVLPTRDSVKVYVFYCNGKNPVLIYIRSRGIATGWYKKNDNSSSNGKDEKWEKVQDWLPNIIPNNFKTTDHGKFDELVKALQKAGGCKKSGICPPDPPPQQRQQEASPAEGSPTSDALADGGASIFAGLGIWSISGISSGTLAGAGGLTGFGWWMFKRSRGDPWIRQI